MNTDDPAAPRKTPAARKTQAPFGLWRSPLPVAGALSQPSAPMHPFRHRGRLYFLQSLAREDGRVALMRQSLTGPAGGGFETACLTPPAFNIRSRVHEYGGRCFCVLGEQFVFNNLADGRIYRQDLGAEDAPAGPPQAVTEVPGAGRAAHFADLIPLPRLQAVIAVMEIFDSGGGADGDGGGAPRSRDALVLVDLGGAAAASGRARPLVLVEGGDFYAAPVLSPDQSQLAWLEWDRPFMPWDQSRLVKAALPGAPRKIAAADREVVAAGAGRAVCQPGFLDDHTLLFVGDSDGGDGGGAGAGDSDSDGNGDGERGERDPGRGRENRAQDDDGDGDGDASDRGVEFWDFFRHISDASGGEIRRVTNDRYEYGEAHWVFVARRWQRLSENTIAAVATAADGDRLLEVMLDSGDTAPLAEGAAVCGDLALHARAAGDELLWVARHATRGAEIHALDLLSGASEVVYRGAGDAADATAGSAAATGSENTDAGPENAAVIYSRPQPLTYPTRDGGEAHAIFYPPANPGYRAAADALPPLMVMVHGGPTARATTELQPLKQYFATCGYAVLDVNHRGSTGYGRAYRQALLGRWGEVDADDIADGVEFLVAGRRIDPGLVFIRGGSAGGYAVLRALTRFPQLFSGGACYYGIGNLITLAQITHRFEGDYTDRLIGEVFDPKLADGDPADHAASRFVQRSPLFQMDKLACPLILFQGADDKVVPPAVSREVAAALRAKGIAHEYIEYENEGHGFRRLETRVDSLEKETAFFAAIIAGKVGVGGGDGDGDGNSDGGDGNGDGDDGGRGDGDDGGRGDGDRSNDNRNHTESP